MSKKNTNHETSFLLRENRIFSGLSHIMLVMNCIFLYERFIDLNFVSLYQQAEDKLSLSEMCDVSDRMPKHGLGKNLLSPAVNHGCRSSIFSTNCK